MKKAFTYLLRIIFALLVAYPVMIFWMGISVRHRDRLRRKGPAIIVANHNSHLDILTLLSLFRLRDIPNIQPAAAADYFFKTPLLRWFSTYCIGIIPVVRGGAKQGFDPLEDCYKALEQGKTLVIFPEGTRGDSEKMGELKVGVWFIAQRFPEVPVIPVFMNGLGRAMPKGTLIPLPLFIGVSVGMPIYGNQPKEAFMEILKGCFTSLKAKFPSLEAEQKI